MLKNLIFLLPVLLTVGCAAQLQLKPDTGESVTLHLFETQNSSHAYGHLAIFQDDYDCYGFSKMGTRASEMPAVKVIPTAGRKFLTVEVNYVGMSFQHPESCLWSVTFPIQSGDKYKIGIGNNSSVCSIEVFRLTKDQESQVPVRLTKRESTKPIIDGQGPWCVKDSAYLGSSSLLRPREQ
ncbi:hypothetical protein [Viridibacterium curvum]|uniref:Lipoprotein n=1 Tax=Viridibacterium curvum TaxID=1101404 RepID=A0ABP9QHV4_9RHOO